MEKIEDLYVSYIACDDCKCKVERYLYENNEEFRELTNKYNLLEDVFDDMMEVEAAEHYEKIVACKTKMEQMKMGHVFRIGFIMSMETKQEVKNKQ